MKTDAKAVLQYSDSGVSFRILHRGRPVISVFEMWDCSSQYYQDTEWSASKFAKGLDTLGLTIFPLKRSGKMERLLWGLSNSCRDWLNEISDGLLTS